MKAKTSDTKQLQSDRSGESDYSNPPNDCVEYAVTAAQRLRSTQNAESKRPRRLAFIYPCFAMFAIRRAL